MSLYQLKQKRADHAQISEFTLNSEVFLEKYLNYFSQISNRQFFLKFQIDLKSQIFHENECVGRIPIENLHSDRHVQSQYVHNVSQSDSTVQFRY